MNREILKSMDTGHIPVQRLTALLETFTLKHAARMLPDLLETADLQDSSGREFLLAVMETEVKGGMSGAGNGITPRHISHQTSALWKNSIRRNWSPGSLRHSLSLLMRSVTHRSAVGRRTAFLLLSAIPMKPAPSSLPPIRRSLTGQR